MTFKEAKALTWSQFQKVATGQEYAAKVVIKPDEAAKILDEKNELNARAGGNRGMRRRVARSLRESYWEVNGATIVFDREWNLIDGQGRLGGCVDSGVSLETWAVYGIAKDVLETDTTTVRKFRDLVASRKFRFAREVSGITYGVCYEQMSGSIWSKAKNAGGAIPFRELMTCLDSLNTVEVWAAEAKRLQVAIGNGVTLALIPYVGAGGIISDLAKWWIEGLATGANLREDDPVLVLRSYMIAARKAPIDKRPLEVVRAACAVLCWNALVRGEPLETIPRWVGSGPHRQPFPRVERQTSVPVSEPVSVPCPSR